MKEAIVVDLFAGGGGASTGIKRALGRDPHIAINHDAAAIAMHRANHPDSQHYRMDIRGIDPRATCAGREVAMLWASPDCRHFSRAKGGAPVSESVRALPWVIPRWLDAVRPRVFFMENVEAFRTWGPVVDEKPDPERKGETFRRWLRRIEKIGYDVELRELSAHHYGTPTSRKRLFVVGRADRAPISWPRPTHGPGMKPFRAAAECIDWSIPCPSIFERSEPLEEATLRRIARGLQKFVIDDPQPFIVPVTHGSDAFRGFGVIDDVFPVVTAANRGELALIAPALVQVSWGERAGQAPRCMDPKVPFGTMVSGGIKHAVAVAHLMQAYGGNYKGEAIRGVDRRERKVRLLPGARAVVAVKERADLGEPVVILRGRCRQRHGELPAGAVVTINSIDYIIVDIGFRMLTARELFNAQGFDADYRINTRADGSPLIVNGKPITKTAQVRCAGNSVCPPLAEALVRANVQRSWLRKAA